MLMPDVFCPQEQKSKDAILYPNFSDCRSLDSLTWCYRLQTIPRKAQVYLDRYIIKMAEDWLCNLETFFNIKSPFEGKSMMILEEELKETHSRLAANNCPVTGQPLGGVDPVQIREYINCLSRNDHYKELTEVRASTDWYFGHSFQVLLDNGIILRQTTILQPFLSHPDLLIMGLSPLPSGILAGGRVMNWWSVLV